MIGENASHRVSSRIGPGKREDREKNFLLGSEMELPMLVPEVEEDASRFADVLFSRSPQTQRRVQGLVMIS